MTDRFRDDNTEGYNPTDLAMLNRVFDMIADRAPDIQASSIDDAIHNSWVPGIGESALFADTLKRLGL